MVEDLGRHLTEERVFALEVIEEGRRCYIRRRRDLFDGRRLESARQEKFLCLLIDARTQLALFSRAAAFGRDLGDSGTHAMDGDDFKLRAVSTLGSSEVLAGRQAATAVVAGCGLRGAAGGRL
ncbi:MAG: hypothetical protein OZ922_04000 [Myxococcales bacterium]|nr:hypothetical protein [Myxococcales bacterium]